MSKKQIFYVLDCDGQVVEFLDPNDDSLTTFSSAADAKKTLLEDIEGRDEPLVALCTPFQIVQVLEEITVSEPEPPPKPKLKITSKKMS